MLRMRNPWWIVAACVCGLVCSGGPINIWTFSVFLKPVADALHIGRSDLAGALAVSANGAEVDLMGFFVSRYFGLKFYGRIMGTMFGIFQVCIGIGPLISTKSFDLYH